MKIIISERVSMFVENGYCKIDRFGYGHPKNHTRDDNEPD